VGTYGPGGNSFLLDHGIYTTFDVTGSTVTYANGISASGQIVGVCDWHGFMVDQGDYTTLDVPRSDGTVASGINASGQIVGNYVDAFGTRGFLATPVP
jgi:uncharacterized membrane protein